MSTSTPLYEITQWTMGKVREKAPDGRTWEKPVPGYLPEDGRELKFGSFGELFDHLLLVRSKLGAPDTKEGLSWTLPRIDTSQGHQKTNVRPAAWCLLDIEGESKDKPLSSEVGNSLIRYLTTDFPYACGWWGSYNYAPDAPRFRVLIQLDGIPDTLNQWVATATEVKLDILAHVPGLVDRNIDGASFKPGQQMYTAPVRPKTGAQNGRKCGFPIATVQPAPPEAKNLRHYDPVFDVDPDITGLDAEALSVFQSHGMYLGETSTPGIHRIICPNCGQHTDGSLEAYLFESNGALPWSLYCHHNHCRELPTPELLQCPRLGLSLDEVEKLTLKGAYKQAAEERREERRKLRTRTMADAIAEAEAAYGDDAPAEGDAVYVDEAPLTQENALAMTASPATPSLPPSPPSSLTPSPVAQPPSASSGEPARKFDVVEDDFFAVLRAVAPNLVAHRPHIPTGMTELDAKIGGGLPPDGLVSLTAPPGLGKTTLALQWAQYIAQTRPVLFVTLEMTRESIIERLAVQHYAIIHKGERGPCFTLDNVQAATQVAEGADPLTSPALRYMPCDDESLPDPGLDPGSPLQALSVWWTLSHANPPRYLQILRPETNDVERLEATVADIIARNKRRDPPLPPPVVFVDYLQYMTTLDEYADREVRSRVRRVTGKLRDIAKETGSPVVVISATSRDKYFGGPRLDAGKESGDIEYDVSLALVLAYRDLPAGDVTPEQWNELKKQSTQALQIGVVKNRYGPYATVAVDYHTEVSMYTEPGVAVKPVEPTIQRRGSTQSRHAPAKPVPF